MPTSATMKAAIHLLGRTVGPKGEFLQDATDSVVGEILKKFGDTNRLMDVGVIVCEGGCY